MGHSRLTGVIGLARALRQKKLNCIILLHTARSEVILELGRQKHVTYFGPVGSSRVYYFGTAALDK